MLWGGGSLAQSKDFIVSAFPVTQGSPHQRPDYQAETWWIRKNWPDEEQGKDHWQHHQIERDQLPEASAEQLEIALDAVVTEF